MIINLTPIGFTYNKHRSSFNGKRYFRHYEGERISLQMLKDGDDKEWNITYGAENGAYYDHYILDPTIESIATILATHNHQESKHYLRQQKIINLLT